MKKRIPLILYIIFASLLITTIVIFSILGKKERVGYISEFNFVENIDNKYVYHIRIKYYDEKVFRNSEIFGVYTKDIENVKWDGGGSPFGIFISDKEISKDDRIDIVYTTKIKMRVWIYVVLILLSILFLYKMIKYDFKIYKNISNIEYTFLPPCIEKIYSKIFIAFVVLLSFFIFSVGFITPIYGDDWVFYDLSGLYHIFDFSKGWWQRGRHIADLLMMLPIGIFGKVGISFGLEPLMSAKIMRGILSVVYMLGQIFTLSTLIYLFNGKKQFKTIFIIVSIFSIRFCTEYFGRIYYMIEVSAYIGTAALSLAAWLPLAYFWIYDKELSFFRDNPNKLLVAVMYTFVLYAATFTLETSSLPIAGLSFFMLCYYIFVDKRIIKCDESKNKLPLSIIYYNLAIIFLTVISVLLTLNSGRGRWQLERIVGESTILNPLSKDGSITATVVILGIIYMLYLVVKALKHKKISKVNYLKITLIAVGLLGVFGFSAIKVIYGLSLLFIVSSLTLFILDGFRRKTILSQIAIPVIIVLMLFELLFYYDEYVLYDYFVKSDRKLVELFIEADAKDKDEIILTKGYLDKNKLNIQRLSISSNIYNSSISGYMLEYGYTRGYITIKAIKDEDLEYEKSEDLNNRKLIYSYPE